MKFTITEKQTVNSVRDPMVKNMEFRSLSDAKRFATKNQAFYGTVLTIEDKCGLVAYKEGGKWHDCERY